LGEPEKKDWGSVAGSLFIPQDSASGLLEQFSGYFGLESIELSAFSGRSAPMDVLLGAERTRRSQVIKQADVLMLTALLPDAFSQERKGETSITTSRVAATAAH
jgi:trehalose/maltose hydrolase-like predicted phosphorylase